MSVSSMQRSNTAQSHPEFISGSIRSRNKFGMTSISLCHRHLRVNDSSSQTGIRLPRSPTLPRNDDCFPRKDVIASPRSGRGNLVLINKVKIGA